MVPTQEE